MNKKGFTLVELIAVIVIIAIIATISFQAVNNRIKNSEEKLYETQKNNIIDAAKKYMLENNGKIDSDHINTICVYISTLQSKGFLDSGKIINPKTKEDMAAIGSNGNSKGVVRVKFNFENNQYEYVYTDLCSSNIVTPIYKTVLDNEELKVINKDDGLYETTDSYVYKGSNPKNYIKFNNKIWRIVSIDKETKRAKIINLDGSQINWPEKGIIDYLNNDFLEGTTYKDVKDYINTNSKWNKGNIDSLDSSLSIISLEKQSNDYKTIGLLTVGEYIDASLNKDCYKENECTSYLNNSKVYWLLNKTNDNKQWYINNGKLLNKEASTTDLYNVYPVLYLNLNTQIDGKGTESEPYVVK
ncbi:MAG: prepilin-type N-terminal cleavage/methylation domain-containing protein [Bacilli bacterium]|nr:prepilin-type N-terminal cleavage/methylation domain-containing protein [Bacilli bacterium]